jgi:hypothetical protein
MIAGDKGNVEIFSPTADFMTRTLKVPTYS